MTRPVLRTKMLEALNMRSIRSSISCSAPAPIDLMTTSPATPMTIPSPMKKLRIL